MLYDQYGRVPKRGSLTESLFSLIAKRRLDQEYYRTKVVVEAVLAPHVKESKVADAFDDFSSSVFPFLRKNKISRDQAAKQELGRWVGRGIKIKEFVHPKVAEKYKSRLKLGAEAVRKAEEQRKAIAHRRIG